MRIRDPEKSKAQWQAYKQRNAEKIRAKEALYREKNREALRQRRLEWYHANPEKVKAKRALYREKARATAKLWRLNNPEKILKNRVKYQAKNRERIRLRQRQWSRNNAESLRVKRELNREKYTRVSQRSNFKRKYGLPLEQYDLMHQQQGGRCVICGIPEDALPQRLGVDHCHDTKKVRGLLCVSCNLGLGNFYDDVELLRKAVKYLELHNRATANPELPVNGLVSVNC
jgi:Recombination endonuclease VII